MISRRRYRFAIENSAARGPGRKSALSISRFRTDELRTGEKRDWIGGWELARAKGGTESVEGRTIEKIIQYNTSRGNSTGACETGVEPGLMIRG